MQLFHQSSNQGTQIHMRQDWVVLKETNGHVAFKKIIEKVISLTKVNFLPFLIEKKQKNKQKQKKFALSLLLSLCF